jgi:hypothetical protein
MTSVELLRNGPADRVSDPPRLRPGEGGALSRGPGKTKARATLRASPALDSRSVARALCRLSGSMGPGAPHFAAATGECREVWRDPEQQGAWGQFGTAITSRFATSKLSILATNASRLRSWRWVRGSCRSQGVIRAFDTNPLAAFAADGAVAAGRRPAEASGLVDGRAPDARNSHGASWARLRGGDDLPPASTAGGQPRNRRRRLRGYRKQRSGPPAPPTEEPLARTPPCVRKAIKGTGRWVTAEM